jgi:predicted HNH restriction endonuclease
LNDLGYSYFNCKHHQEGLIVLCKNCHVTAHKKLRGTYKPERQTAKQGVLL